MCLSLQCVLSLWFACVVNTVGVIVVVDATCFA